MEKNCGTGIAYEELEGVWLHMKAEDDMYQWGWDPWRADSFDIEPLKDVGAA